LHNERTHLGCSTEHIAGAIPKALASVGPALLASEPDSRTVDIVAGK
jgi:hypothetical protein